MLPHPRWMDLMTAVITFAPFARPPLAAAVAGRGMG
jgi:hypothetical protein